MSSRSKMRPDVISKGVKALLRYRNKAGQPLFVAKGPKPARPRLVAWMPPSGEMPVLGAVMIVPGAQMDRERQLALIGGRLETLATELQADDPELLHDLAMRLVENGLTNRAPEEPAEWASLPLEPQIAERLDEMGALLPRKATKIVPEASNPKAVSQMEETGLLTWVSALIP